MKCEHCKGNSTVFLCPTCTRYLREMTNDLPWLLQQLEITRLRMDRLTVGVVGKGANPSPINVGAMELSRTSEILLASLVGLLEEVGCQFLPPLGVFTDFIGPLRPGWRRLPRGYSGSPIQRARWLAHHIDDIARHPQAGHFFNEICSLVGDPDRPNSEPGRLVRAINRNTRIFAGPCPHVVGYNHHGEPVSCGLILYADEGQEDVECGRCHVEVNVAKNRLRATVDKDLLTELKLLEMMEIIGEPVSRYRFLEWLKQGHLHARGWIHQGNIVGKRVRRGDPRVYSLSQCRILRSRDEDQQKVSA